MGAENSNNSWFILISVLSVNMLSFSGNAGYPWTSPFLPKLNGNVDPEKNPLSTPVTVLEESWITSLHSLGALFGLIFTGKMSEKLGKKTALIYFSIPILVSNIMLIFAKSLVEFYISRFLLGIGTAAAYAILPSYVAEITEVRDRGKAGIVMSLMIALSHFAVVVIGPYVTIRTFAYLSLIPSLIFYGIFVPFVPESPYYYVLCNNMKKAENSLKVLKKREDVKLELEEIVETTTKTMAAGSFLKILNSKAVRRSLLIALGLVLCQNANGNIPVTVYQQEIFHLSESIIPSHISVIIVGVTQLIATILVLMLIDKVGRKILFYISFVGLFMSLMGLGTYYNLTEHGYNVDSIFWIPLICINIFMACYRMGAGPVTWTIIGEIFPANLKEQFCSLATAKMVFGCFVASMVYPVMVTSMGLSWTFWTFGVLTAFAIMFIIFCVPEIKGKSFLEIQELLRN